MENIIPKVGLVTVLYNGVEVLADFFKSLSSQRFSNYTLYVIDNSPDAVAIDMSRQLAREYSIPCVFHKCESNIGVAAGNNIGIKQSIKDGCDYTILLNNDIDFNHNTLFDLISFTTLHNEKLVVPKIYYAGTNRIWMAGGKLSKCKGSTTHRGEGEIDSGAYDSIEYIDYAPTCFMLIDNSVFSTVGFMDEKYFVYYDDTDFVFRATNRGYKICYFPDVLINHKVSISTGGDRSPFSIYYGNRNRFYFIKKNLKGMHRYISFAFFFFSRGVLWAKFTAPQRESLKKAMRDMWRL
ncbi:glycosyltransferase family 2 protein [Pectobacterium carotovorum]|uniref:glycosyltransferase family 2 protein n=1 Tax=Pectobacterium carotovorum TaxID=554 RepID=UPI001CF9624D|nr:glycosyltransferase family 2 protein [Pectobacterium carotovorum]UCZ80855.1 glycosyltransferase family 2 protein [Pectobacterium carotovorum]